ncbi:hypothetical protein O1O06_16325 [Grimontia hollisae]|uniref:hypothetical protein n=1 Tax=Grimontia hollisae TaxID=673 RepID=UPI0023DC2D40|nr:hypothetical protein [Grimontia hollisae]MDF2186308.1 hypothetical protein [Grimontia hollisae]
MAITIRNTDEHSEMLETLKALTGEATLTKALISAGYMAIKLDKLHRESVERTRQLTSQHNELKRDVNSFMGALDKLRNV